MKLEIFGEYIADGIDTGERWNGFVCPIFPRSEWKKVAHRFGFSEINGQLISKECDEHDDCAMTCKEREAWPINADGTCSIGSGAWIWSQFVEWDLTDEQIREFRGGSFVHCDRPTDWDSCDDHDDCMSAVCLICGGYWCDSIILGA